MENLDGPYIKCWVCACDFPKLSYRKHYMSQHSKDHGKKPFSCAECDYKTTTAVCIRLHNKNNHRTNKDGDPGGLEGKLVKCWVCSSTFPILTYRRHFLAEHSEEHGQNCYACPQCDHKSNERPDVRKHYRSVHLKQRKRCPVCEKPVVCLARHVKIMHSKEEKKEKCDLCNYRAYRPCEIVAHIRASHSAKVACPHCKSLVAPGYLRNHIKYVHGDYKPFGCDACDYRANARQTVEKHFDAIHRVGPLEAQCELCDFQTRREGHLRNHVRRVHLNIKGHHCPNCDFREASAGLLRQHMRKVHEKVRKFTCEACSYAAAERRRLESHVNRVHLHLKKFECNICEKTYGSQQAVKAHVRSSHRELQKFNCEQCDYNADTRQYLNRHLKARHINNATRIIGCPECHKTLSSKSGLKTHLARLHGIGRNTLCEECDYAAVDSSDLRVHMQKSHWHKKVHECRHCPKAFVTTAQMNNHVRRVHEGRKPHKCADCDYSTAHWTSIKLHKKKHQKSSSFP